MDSASAGVGRLDPCRGSVPGEQGLWSTGVGRPRALVTGHDEAPPADCTASIVTVTVYTPRDRFLDHEIATEDVRAVLRAALDRDFVGIESIRISPAAPG